MTQREIWVSDNLEFLCELDTGSAGLVYMDPPFASSRDYHAVLTKDRTSGLVQVPAFVDSNWRSLDMPTGDVATEELESAYALISFVRASGQGELAGYLAMMLPRLVQARRVLSLDGSLYLHCDSSAAHYLKVLLDQIMGAENFRNEIVWKRTHAHSGARRYGPVHDVILFYSRSSTYIWNQSYTAYEESYINKYYRSSDAHGRYQLITCTGPGDRQGTRAHYEWKGVLPPPGRHWAWKIEKMEELDRQGRLVYSSSGIPRLKRYLSEGAGVAIQDVWLDIQRLDAHSEERVGYETQKPIALLNRIIESSTAPGSLVVDPFAGSGTTAVASESSGRAWAVADRSLLAGSIALSRARKYVGSDSIKLVGFPASKAEAENLFHAEPQTFGVWGTSMMATQFDRVNSTAKVVSGTGVLPIQGKKQPVLSWVPVADGPVTSDYRRKSRRLPRLGFFLTSDRNRASQLGRLRAEYPALPLVPVGLDSLVAQGGRRHGLSEDVISALNAAG